MTIEIKLLDIAGEKVWSNSVVINALGLTSRVRGWRGVLDDLLESFRTAYGGFDPDAQPALLFRLESAAQEWKRIAMSEQDVKAYLSAKRAEVDPVEGIWLTANERIAVVRDPREDGQRLIGFVLDTAMPYWSPGHVRLELDRAPDPETYFVVYYDWDFSPQETTATLADSRNLEISVNALLSGTYTLQLFKAD